MEDPTYNLTEELLTLPSPNFFFSPNFSPNYLNTPGAASNFSTSNYFSYVPPAAKFTPAQNPSPREELSRISLAPPPAPHRLSYQQPRPQQQFLFEEEESRETFVTKQTFDGMVLSCSENVQKFLGYDALSLCNTSTYELIHPDDLDRLLQVHLKLIEGGPATKLQATYRVLRKSGDYADISSTFIAEGSAIICYSVDLCPAARPSPPVAFFCSAEELMSSSASSSATPPSQTSLDCVRCELRAFDEDGLQQPENEGEEVVLDEGSFASGTYSPALSPVYSPHRHSSESTSEGSSEYECEEDDKDETYGQPSQASHHKVAKPKPKGKVTKSTLTGRSKESSNPKRERRMRRPPFGESCGECHIFESTEWRKGPSPNRLLCNACGLRYTRKVKKEMKEKMMTSQ